ncbi:hypothetical protein SUGI_0347400 [Cryptomeria japonica]|nr:hypothetical protein SUGI_0347400 [Cryptomeria japonica]
MQMPQRRRQGNCFQLLPEEITIEILSRLPFSNVLKARSVCHSWQNIVCSSPHFHKLWDEKNSEQWLFMDDRDGGVQIFNPSGQSKKKMFDSSSWLLKAASGGLLLYKHKTEELLQVVNPLTMEARQLPDPRITLVAVDLVVDSTTKTYEVIVFGSGTNLTADLSIFRSITSSWEIKVVEIVPRFFNDFSPYKTVGNQTVYCFPLQGQDLPSYNLCGEIVHANEKYGEGLKGFVMGTNVKVAIFKPPIGRSFEIIFELDEASSQWRLVSVCRWNLDDPLPFGELLCEKDFVFSCLSASKDCIWIIPAFSDKDVYQTMLMLEEDTDIFKSHGKDLSVTFPMPLKFSQCP